jgi:hypothetical protein
VYAGTVSPPLEIADAHRMTVAAAKGGGAEFTLLTPVKPRPVLVVTNPLAPYNETIVLRLKRLNTFSESEQHEIREHRDTALFHLKPDSFPGLEIENAAIVTSMLRLPMTALDTTTELGAIDERELRALHERIATTIGLRLEAPILRKAQELHQTITDQNTEQ